MVGDVCLKAWSTTQRVVVLSSGEAEYYAAIKGASEGLGFLAGCADFGKFGPMAPLAPQSFDRQQFVQGDLPENRPLGKIRHIDVAIQWLQDLVRKGKIQMSQNPRKGESR